MKKIMAFVLPIKAMAAMIFAGLMCLYMLSGILYAGVTGVEFNYMIPFIFVLQGLGLSVLIAILWELFFSNTVIKKWRFFLRHVMFEISLLALLAVCFLTFSAIPTDWAKLWLIAAGSVAVGIIAISGIGEMYYKKTGKRYTEILRNYKMGNLQN
jgi:phosphatidylserine synthase